MLFDQTFVLQEGWEEVPFVLRCIDGCLHILLVVERLEGGIEAVNGGTPVIGVLLSRCILGVIDGLFLY